MNLELIPINQLDANVHNVRRNLGDLSELADSIKAVGVLQPLTIAPRGDFFESRRYVVIAGHRRHAAAKAAGVDLVPCVIRPDLTLEIDQIEAMLVENLQRTDLTPLEEAVAYEQLQLMGVKPGQIAKKTGRSASTVSARLGLMKLPESLRTSLGDGQLTLASAELAVKYADDAEIMAAFETHGVAEWRAEWILAARKRAEEQAKNPPQPSNGHESRGYDPIAARQAAVERQAEFDRKRTTGIAANAVRSNWVEAQVAANSTTLWTGLARIALDQAVRDWEGDDALAALGIPACLPDEDRDDHALMVSARLDKWSEIQQLHALALILSNAINRGAYYDANLTRDLVDRCGYIPVDEELELLRDEAYRREAVRGEDKHE